MLYHRLSKNKQYEVYNCSNSDKCKARVHKRVDGVFIKFVAFEHNHMNNHKVLFREFCFCEEIFTEAEKAAIYAGAVKPSQIYNRVIKK